MAVVGDLWFSVRAGAGRDDRSGRSAADRRLAGRPQWRPVDCAGAGVRALRARVPSEQVERAALRVDEDLAEVLVRDADRGRLSVRDPRRGRGPLALLPPLLPQPATANAASTSTVALARNVVMLAPFVECVNGSRSEHPVARRGSPLGVTGEIPSRAPWSTHSRQRRAREARLA